MNTKNIICVDLRKFNYDQLTKVSEFIGILDGSLQSAKKEGFIKSFFDSEKKSFIGVIHKDINRCSRTYKGLFLTEEYTSLSKKEKDILIKMDGTKIELKKSTTQKQVDYKPEKEVSDKVSDELLISDLEEILDVDLILEKIHSCGINSLTRKEKEYLDEESKKL
jgi:hypothetical protein